MEVKTRFLATLLIVATFCTVAHAQFSGQLPPGSVLGNPSTSASSPARPTGSGETGTLLLGGECPSGGFLCGAASPLTLGSGQYNTYLNIDGGVVGSGTDASVVHRKGGLPIAEAGVGFNVIDTDYHIKTVIPARFTASQSGTTLTVSALTTGVIVDDALVFDHNPPFLVNGSSAVPANNTVVTQLSGTTGGVGTYQMTQSATVPSRTMISEKFEDRLIHNNWQSTRAGWTDLVNDQGVSVFYQSGLRYLSFGSLVPNFVTGLGSGEGMALTYDMNSSNGFWTCVSYGASYQPCIIQASDLRFSTAFLDSLDNAVVEITPDGALAVAHPTRYALEATTFNLGEDSIATMHSYVAGSSIVTACTTASKFCVQVGTPPSFLVATTQVATAAKNAAGSGGTNSVPTTTTAASLLGASTLTVASTSGIANADNIFVTCGGGTANEPAFYTGTVNGAPSGSTVTVTPVLTCHVNSGLAVVAKYTTLTGATGTGTRYTAAGKVVLGALDSVLGILTHGSYTVNPIGCAASVASCSETVTATGGLTGASTTIAMGALTFTLNAAGAVGADTTRTYPQTPVQTTSSDNGVNAKLAIRYTDYNSVNSGPRGFYDMGVAPTGTVATGWTRAGNPTFKNLTVDRGAGVSAIMSFADGGTTKFDWFKAADNSLNLFHNATGQTPFYVGVADVMWIGVAGTTGSELRGAWVAKDQLLGTYNGSAVVPSSSTTAGWAITSNFAGDGEVDLWSTVDSTGTQGFFFYQKTGASTYQKISAIIGDAAFAEHYITQGGNTSWHGLSASEVYFGTASALPLNFYVSNNLKVAVNSTGINITGKITTSDTAFLHNTSAALANGAAAAVGTLNNAPAAGDPTKWIPINDNGTTRHVPAW